MVQVAEMYWGTNQSVHEPSPCAYWPIAYSVFRYKHSSNDTPLPTPSYKYNDWMDNKKKIKYTPRDSNRKGNNNYKIKYELPFYIGSLTTEEAITTFSLWQKQ